jgi:hypothetical protein
MGRYMAPVAGKKVVALRAEDWSLGSPEFATPELGATDPSEWMKLMLEASLHFGINARENVFPKHEELVAYFLSRRLADGTPISPRQAKNLATLCRPPVAMKGGNRKHGRRVTP